MLLMTFVQPRFLMLVVLKTLKPRWLWAAPQSAEGTTSLCAYYLEAGLGLSFNEHNIAACLMRKFSHRLQLTPHQLKAVAFQVTSKHSSATNPQRIEVDHQMPCSAKTNVLPSSWHSSSCLVLQGQFSTSSATFMVRSCAARASKSRQMSTEVGTCLASSNTAAGTVLAVPPCTAKMSAFSSCATCSRAGGWFCASKQQCTTAVQRLHLPCFLKHQASMVLHSATTFCSKTSHTVSEPDMLSKRLLGLHWLMQLSRHDSPLRTQPLQTL